MIGSSIRCMCEGKGAPASSTVAVPLPLLREAVQSAEAQTGNSS